jgi:ribonuclease HIII
MLGSIFSAEVISIAVAVNSMLLDYFFVNKLENAF